MTAKEERLMEALGSIRDTYVLEAACTTGKRRQRSRRWAAAVLALLLGAALFAQTSVGGTAAAFVKEQVVSWIEALFPPKELTAAPEGAPETETYTAGGQLPQQSSAAAKPGFAIYYDPERYEMTEENGVTYIRSIPVVPTREEIRASNAALLEGLPTDEAEAMVSQLLEQQKALQAALPPCELEIRHIPDITPEAAVAAARLDMQQSWTVVCEPELYSPLACPCFHANGGTAWDAPVAYLYFVGDTQTGTYQLTVRCFVEAIEGHGARLHTILNTFHVIPPG